MNGFGRRLATRVLALLVAGLVGSSLAFAALSPDAFTQEFVTSLRARLPDCKIEIIKSLELRISKCGGADSSAYLDNAYNSASADPDSRQEIIEQHVGAFAESLGELPPLDPKNIVPIIKERGWPEEVRADARRRGGKEPADQVVEKFNDQLVIVYAEDTPLNIRYITGDILDKAGVDRRKLRAMAVANLRRKLPDIKTHEGPVISMLTAGGNYEASLLLLDELWSSGRFKVDGDIVIAVPSRDVLLITGSKNSAGIARLRELAGQIMSESNYTLTTDLFVYRKGAFQRLED
jgi:uncharacterized protein YtpQ (UPF0354 family)